MVDCMLSVAASAAGGYLLGSVSGALLLGGFRRVDIRRLGSGNPGATNALRTVGWSFAAAVVLVDLGKGVVAAAAVPKLIALIPVVGGTASFCTLAAASGTAAVVGHIWPVFFRFRGGKGASTLVGVIAVVAPWCLIPMLLVWGIALLGSGYVGLATIGQPQPGACHVDCRPRSIAGSTGDNVSVAGHAAGVYPSRQSDAHAQRRGKPF